MKRKLAALLCILGSIMITVLMVELFLQLYVHHIIKKGKLFETDKVLGWKLKPNLNITRINPNGEIWKIRTNFKGIRGNSEWNNSKRSKMLILGDSYAFGEGVNLERRFDFLMAKNNLDYSIINLGVMGYGADQQILAARPYFSSMKKGDVVLLLTCHNDFYDLLRKKHSGRSKPWYELINGKLKLHNAKITSMEILREKSYLFAKINSLFDHYRVFSSKELTNAMRIYQALTVELARKLKKKQVLLLIAYHGMHFIADVKQREIIENGLKRMCDSEILQCLDMDKYFEIAATKKELYFSDGHWNKNGHILVSQLISKKIDQFGKTVNNFKQ